MVDTGFKRHIDVVVDNEGEKPSEDAIEHIKNSLGENYKEKWFNVKGLGYGKDWIYVAGV